MGIERLGPTRCFDTASFMTLSIVSSEVHVLLVVFLLELCFSECPFRFREIVIPHSSCRIETRVFDLPFLFSPAV